MADGAVTEAVEEAAEQVAVEAAQVIRGHSTAMVVIGIGVGIGIGAGVGYLLARRLLETKYQELAEEEISQMRDHFRDKWAAAESREANRKTKLDEEVERLGYKPATTPEDEKPPEVEVPEPETENVFEKEQPTAEEIGEPVVVWDYQRELESRSATKPYVIHKQEFAEGEEQGRENVSYTYYSGDDVLADERDSPLDNMDELVGLENLEKFGHGSEDPNVVYVRNESLGLDMEVCRSMGEFAKEVGNIDPDPEDLMHSSQRRHRSRPGDDD